MALEELLYLSEPGSYKKSKWSLREMAQMLRVEDPMSQHPCRTSNNCLAGALSHTHTHTKNARLKH